MFYSKRQIIQLLVQKGFLTLQHAEELLSIQKKEGSRLSRLLIEKKFIPKESLFDFVNSSLNIPHLETSQIKITPEAVSILPRELANKYNIFPLMKTEAGITLGISDPLTIMDLEDIKELKGHNINPVLVSRVDLIKLINKYYASEDEAIHEEVSMEEILGETFTDISVQAKGELEATDLAQITQEMPIVKATNFILDKAIESRASDILIEPLENATRIRFRVDGIYHQIETLPRSFHPFIISRIKVISDLDIAEHRFPQDGQFKIKLRDKEVDFRVSVFPAITGEKVAIRILDKSMGLMGIENLGLKEKSLERLKKTSELPHGMILVCGPTGSGKTSTLYSLLKYIHSPEKNIITVEDPVEYQLKGINQVSVNLKTGLTFARCLRSILRQDPDIIMIGEIRDFETVDIAIKAALTGHLVLSTLHTTTAAGSVVRLIDMGVEPFLINASVLCILAQRLARRICAHCKEPVPGQPYFRGKGCPECLQTGYSGRILIPEILYMSPAIRESIISERLEEKRIKEIACSEGMLTLRQEGEDLARAGITSFEEVLRVTPAD